MPAQATLGLRSHSLGPLVEELDREQQAVPRTTEAGTVGVILLGGSG